MPVKATEGFRMNVLIRRRANVSREELIANWFANHMPAVIKNAAASALAKRPHTTRYIATLFDPLASGPQAWDGIAQLWWPMNLPKPAEPFGTKPADTFQQKAEPYMPWMVKEFVVMDGALPVTPNTLNEPFPFTRSGFYKITGLMKIKKGSDPQAFFKHWLEVHAPNVKNVMEQVGGFRYVIAQSVDPAAEEFAGQAELYFPNAAALDQFQKLIKPDGLEQWTDSGTQLYTSSTEMVGIP